MLGCLIATASATLAFAQPEPPAAPPRELPTWREGPPVRLPPTSTTPTQDAGSPASRKWVVLGGGALVLVGLFLYNRRAKAALSERLARQDADDR